MKNHALLMRMLWTMCRYIYLGLFESEIEAARSFLSMIFLNAYFGFFIILYSYNLVPTPISPFLYVVSPD